MMNNKGFTVIELLTTVVLISLLAITISSIVGKTLAVSSSEAYKILKSNIVKASYTYVNECKAGTIACDSNFKTNHTFYAKELEKYGFFKDLKSPIDGSYLGECIEIKVTYDNGSSIVELIDNCNH